jgi:hypothetical protein
VNSAPDVAVSPNSISNEEKIQLEIVRGIAAYVQALQLLLKWVNCQARILNRNDVLNPPRNVARNACLIQLVQDFFFLRRSCTGTIYVIILSCRCRRIES